jgi:hypothetical protein
MTGSLRLQLLINQMIDGCISPDDLHELQEILRSSHDARRQYFDMLAVDQLLMERFEIPDSIVIHARAIDHSWALDRFRTQLVCRSLLGAAAALMAGILIFFALRPSPPNILVTPSADSHFFIADKRADQGTPRPWRPGETLRIKHGAATAELTPFVEACIEGSSFLRLRDRDGSIDLEEGKAHFQIAPGSKNFEVHVPGAVIRDIGTRFGVEVRPDGASEVHVSSGRVVIDFLNQSNSVVIDAGSAVCWTGGGAIQRRELDSERFLQSLPRESTLFSDDFSEPDGTQMSGKRPDVGQPWMVGHEDNPTRILAGALDTSYGSRSLTGSFRHNPLPGRRAVYLLTVQTRRPKNAHDKTHYNGSSEEIAIWNGDGERLFSLWAGSESQHNWVLRDSVSQSFMSGSECNAMAGRLVTLRYERESGLLTMFNNGLQGEQIEEIQISPGKSPAFLTVANVQGGDVALSRIEVKVITYSQKSRVDD